MKNVCCYKRIGTCIIVTNVFVVVVVVCLCVSVIRQSQTDQISQRDSTQAAESIPQRVPVQLSEGIYVHMQPRRVAIQSSL